MRNRSIKRIGDKKRKDQLLNKMSLPNIKQFKNFRDIKPFNSVKKLSIASNQSNSPFTTFFSKKLKSEQHLPIPS